MKQFIKPEFTIIENQENKNSAEFLFGPLERGFGITIGNALRRTLLSSTPGGSIYAIKIVGANHEFTSIPGIVENVSRIILNIKKLILKVDTNIINDDEICKLTINSDVEGDIKGKDIVCPAGIEILNKDQHLCTLASGGVLDLVMFAKYSRGYRTFKENKKERIETGSITIDSNYSPIVNVKYDVNATISGKSMDYEKLSLTITTNGAITPKQAISIASKIIIEHLNVAVNFSKNTLNLQVLGDEVEETEKELDRLIEELDFTQRSLNCLKRANINTLRELVDKTEYEVQEIKNLGKKSLKEIKDKVAQLGLSFKIS